MYFVPSSDGVHGSAGLSWREGKKTGTDYLYLGTVLDLERGIFQSEKRGVFTFDFCTGNIGKPPDDFVVPETPEASSLSRASFDFGDAFVFNALLHKTGFMEVVDTLIPGAGVDADTLHALVLFYALSSLASDHADAWYQSSVACLLYPCASLDGGRIRGILDKLGQPEAARIFHEAHLKFVLTRRAPERTVLVDSTAMPSVAGIPLSQICPRGGEACGRLRLIAAVQRKSGYPLFCQAVAGDASGADTLDKVVGRLSAMGVAIGACMLDGEHCTLSILDLLYDEEHNLKIPYVMKLKSSDKEYARLAEEDIAALKHNDNIVRCGSRAAYIVKKKICVGKNMDNPAWMYLVLDLLCEGGEQKSVMERSAGKDMDDAEFAAGQSSKGLLCLVSGEDLPCSRILSAYGQRQAAEQLTDCLKNYAKMHPLGSWKDSTVQGHILLAYIAFCAGRLMQSRLDVAGLPFGAGLEILRTQKCTRYANRIVVDVPQKPVRDTCKALGIGIPKSIPRAGAGLRYVPPAAEPLRDPGAGAGASGAPAGQDRAAGEAVPEAAGAAGADGRQKPAPVSAVQEAAEPKRGPGRPKGSKNKKTLEREERERAEEEARKAAGVEAEPRRGPGRPKGSKNKKTLEREERERAEEEARKRAEEEAKPKRGPGRPKGSKNKKTLEREAAYRAKAGLEPKRGRGRPKGSKNRKKEVENPVPPGQEAVQEQPAD